MHVFTEDVKIPFLIKVFTYYSALLKFAYSHTYQRRFTITPLAIIRPEHSRTTSGPWGLYTPVLPNNFSRCTKVETVLSQVLILRLSEPRPTFRQATCPRSLVWRPSENRTHNPDILRPVS